MELFDNDVKYQCNVCNEFFKWKTNETFWYGNYIDHWIVLFCSRKCMKRWSEDNNQPVILEDDENN